MTTAQARKTEVLARLYDVEFERKQYGGGSGALTPYVIYECRYCHADRADGHAKDCVMAGLIRDLETHMEEGSRNG